MLKFPGNKANQAGAPDSRTATKAGALERNSLDLENVHAIENAGLTPEPYSTQVDPNTQQLSQALFINGVAAASFQDSGSANAYVITPVTGATGLRVPPAYSQLDGGIVQFLAGATNTGASTVNLGQTTGALLGVKDIRSIGGAALTGGEIESGQYLSIRFNVASDYWEIVGTTGGGGLSGNDTFYVGGGALTPSITSGASPETVETTNLVTRSVMTFSGSSDTSAGFSAPLPNWDLGTVTATYYWKPKIGASIGDTIEMDIAAVAVGNDDVIDVALGTAQAVVDTVTADTDLHISPASSAITVAGTPAAGDEVFFKMTRDVSGGTMTEDLELLGVLITFGIA